MQTGIQRESISSDEENETSLDESDLSCCEDGSLTDSDGDGDNDTHTDTVPYAMPEHHPSRVCARYLLMTVIKNISLNCCCYEN